jgi:hypothetical protein
MTCIFSNICELNIILFSVIHWCVKCLKKEWEVVKLNTGLRVYSAKKGGGYHSVLTFRRLNKGFSSSVESSGWALGPSTLNARLESGLRSEEVVAGLAVRVAGASDILAGGLFSSLLLFLDRLSFFRQAGQAAGA